MPPTGCHPVSTRKPDSSTSTPASNATSLALLLSPAKLAMRPAAVRIFRQPTASLTMVSARPRSRDGTAPMGISPPLPILVWRVVDCWQPCIHWRCGRQFHRTGRYLGQGSLAFSDRWFGLLCTHFFRPRWKAVRRYRGGKRLAYFRLP